ncbi:hypothetical protein IE53DRAFT_388520 [Violaceomyces palustris]|uniref:Uncharacterized protein n=1 Tax=Violaceomyces palustris TaxID=1673888 RepID=A0ACD0NU65_9BASI|nr:hypothetical protein IE53DRAFT_388520 [Violaceomyces palustris]
MPPPSSSSPHPPSPPPRGPFPPFETRSILFPALPKPEEDPSSNPESPFSLGRSIKCIQAYQNHQLLVATSDGYIHIYSLPQQATSSNADRYQLSSSHRISNKSKAVERILVLAGLDAVAVLCEGSLAFYSLPDLLPITTIPPTRPVSTVVLDDDEVENSQGRDAAGMVSLCVVKRKTVLLAKVARQGRELRWAVIKEIPLPSGAVIASRYGDTLCVACPTFYSLVDLSDGSITRLPLPISETVEVPTAQEKPSIVSIPCRGYLGFNRDQAAVEGEPAPKCEFLITSHSESNSLGVFMSPSGEPTPKLLDWPSHPRGVVHSYPYLISLLRNDTIEVHDLRTAERVQRIHLPPGLEPRFLSQVGTGFSTNDSVREPRGALLPSLEEAFADRMGEESDPFALVQLNLSSQQVVPYSSSPAAKGQRTSSTRLYFDVILGGKNAIQTVSQGSLWQWGKELIRKSRWFELRGVLERPGTPRSKAEARQLVLLRMATALEHLRLLQFDRAGRGFAETGLDPRLVIRLFRSYRGGIDGKGKGKDDSSWDEITTLVGLQGQLLDRGAFSLAADDVDEMIWGNLRMNYSPPLQVESDPVTMKLRDMLSQSAERMLLQVLRAWRNRRRGEGEGSVESDLAGLEMSSLVLEEIDKVVDTTLAKLLASREGEESSRELDSLVDGKNSCESQELEWILRSKGKLCRLSRIYENERRWDEMLEIWTGLIDGSLQDPSSSVTVQDVAVLLTETNDPRLRSKYAIWLVQKDPQEGVKLLTKQMSTGLQDVAVAPAQGQLTSSRQTLSKLKAIDQVAANTFLEHVVLHSKDQAADLHDELCQKLLDRISEAMRDEACRTRVNNLASEYSSGSYAESFFAHLALAALGDVDGEEVRNSVMLDRLKLSMLLQGSEALDHEKVVRRVEKCAALAYEKAILLGKLGRDQEALSLLALNLKDANSSEVYCSEGRVVLPTMMAETVAKDLASRCESLVGYAAMVARSQTPHPSSSKAGGQQRILNGSEDKKDKVHVDKSKRKEELVKILLGVYMGADQGVAEKEGEDLRTATAHLVNTQASDFDSVEMLKLVPDSWPLSTLETFLTQSLRRSMHARNQARMVRNLRLGRNLDVYLEGWERSRSLGGIINESEDDGFDGGEDDDGREEEGAGGQGVEIRDEKLDSGFGLGVYGGGEEGDGGDGVEEGEGYERIHPPVAIDAGKEGFLTEPTPSSVVLR